MSLQGPRIVRGTPPLPPSDESTLERALRLAREVEELLEEPASSAAPERSAHSTRIARALAASLVDELKTLDPTDRKRGLC